ncbi:MAG TPA: glutathione S-transferase family protein [Gammaproteobacteria bacterium]|nr:glutathione S-transferase family protein [Gammaproteobacteria bacterium]|tara:strand:+ start:790 stop:1410 length:621 start_codon:yes stop_codon:yes gene_type:complete
MSIKLYGMPLSNYYNMVKAILLEKGMQFEEVLVTPNQEDDYLAKSPMGKVPCLETEQGFLTETGVMLDYLDALGEGPSFYPEDVFAKAKVQELMRYLELYIELPGRRLYGDVFFGRPASDEEKAAVKPILEKGFAALQKIARFDPYIAGTELTYADFYFLFAMAPVTLVCKKTWEWDVREEIPAIQELNALLGERESVKRVQADQK